MDVKDIPIIHFPSFIGGSALDYVSILIVLLVVFLFIAFCFFVFPRVFKAIRIYIIYKQYKNNHSSKKKALSDALLLLPKYKKSHCLKFTISEDIVIEQLMFSKSVKINEEVFKYIYKKLFFCALFGARK